MEAEKNGANHEWELGEKKKKRKNGEKIRGVSRVCELGEKKKKNGREEMRKSAAVWVFWEQVVVCERKEMKNREGIGENKWVSTVSGVWGVVLGKKNEEEGGENRGTCHESWGKTQKKQKRKLRRRRKEMK